MAKAENMGDYYRVPADCRDLNYACYLTEGAQEVSVMAEYNSHNTKQLDVKGMCDLFLKLEMVREAIGKN
jgi:UDP-N-acetylglucosamine 4,6-dehydratase